jgi:hypothetical protein
MQARQAERFARLDVDRDGQLTREERRAGRKPCAPSAPASAPAARPLSSPVATPIGTGR